MALFQSRMQKKAFRGENWFDLSETKNWCRTRVRTSKGSFGVPSFPFAWETRSNDWYWFGTDGIKFKKIRKIYGEESAHNRKNKFDFDNKHQNRTYFFWERTIVSLSFFCWYKYRTLKMKIFIIFENSLTSKKSIAKIWMWK